MPFFTVEENRIADDIGASDMTFYLHTAAPTDAAPTNGRTTVGGGGYENGIVIDASDISVAALGDIDVDVDIDFGDADEAVGDGNAPIGVSQHRARWLSGTLEDTDIAVGDSFKINAQYPALLGQQHITLNYALVFFD